MEQRKTAFIGSMLILSGSILLGLMHLAIALYMPSMTYWETPPGLFEATEKVHPDFFTAFF